MNDNAERRTASLGLRVYPSMREALSQAARDDHRTVASLVEKVLSDWLRENGYLPRSPG